LLSLLGDVYKAFEEEFQLRRRLVQQSSRSFVRALDGDQRPIFICKRDLYLATDLLV
jgi:hypothetical protein